MINFGGSTKLRLDNFQLNTYGNDEAYEAFAFQLEDLIDGGRIMMRGLRITDFWRSNVNLSGQLRSHQDADKPLTDTVLNQKAYTIKWKRQNYGF